LTVSLIQHLREYERRERNRLEIHVRPMPPAAAA
jgi:hypothetical protein